MNQAIRSARANPPPVLLSPLESQKASAVKLWQVKSMSTRPESENPSFKELKKDPNNPPEKTGDVMSHSFGEGYATRSDEEGFGGIYGGNQSIPNVGIDENHPDYDKTQGSEVKEKEKGRHQTNASS